MSKIKDELQRIRETEFDQYVSYMEWVCDQEVSESDTKEVEEDIKMSSTTGASIVHYNTLKAVNNIDYYPKLGA
ncbi:MAG: hypothetical protein LT067_06410 [Sulfurovum sp.]|nr:hypothetical protein [Sulfurovum sp.]